MEATRLLDLGKNDIKILQVLKNNGEARFVEFRSIADKKDRILNVEKFCEIFGYTEDEIKEK